MFSLRLAAAFLLTATPFFVQDASAFTTDDRSMNTPANASNYSDPDEKSPLHFFSGSSSDSAPSFNGSQNVSNAQPNDQSDSARAPAMSSFDRYSGRQ